MAKSRTSNHPPTGGSGDPEEFASGGPPTVRTCGTMPVHERLLRTVPAYAAARIQSENHAWGFARNMLSGARTGVTVIPVVVHVVYKTTVQNISDAQIKSQITILNQDFRKTNPDVNSTPAVFKPLCGDSRIEFELASKDPNGNPTTGITRTSTTKTSFSQDDGVKSTATGGANAWPAADYLNIWVCQLGGNLLGYAQFPGGPAATDGVVILHSGFGNTGTAAAPFNLGRSATHEIGHWLNLRHIWGDDAGGCNGDDFVSDTPNCGNSNTGKPAFPHITCNNGPNGDMFMNYMDYTDDDSMFMFTNGQILRMQACLDGDRSTIGHRKAGPTISIADLNHPTFAHSDVHPTVSILDLHPTLAIVDMQPTITILDRPHGTVAQIDLQPTLGGQDAGNPGLPGNPGDPGPMFGAGAGGHMPFVLSTPHHTAAWQQSFPALAQQQAQALAAQLQQYQAVLNQFAQAERGSALSAADSVRAEQVAAEYSTLLAEYQQLTGT